MQIPVIEDGSHLVKPLLRDDDEHALLALGEHYLIGRHARLATRHLRHVDLDADAALAGAFDRRTGQSGRAEILHGDHVTGLEHLAGRLRAEASQEMGCRPAPRRDAISPDRRPRRRSPRECRLDRSRRRPAAPDYRRRKPWRRIRFVTARDANAHGIDQRITGIRAIEEDVPGDRRNPETVAVAADAADNAAEEIAIALLRQRAKAQRIENAQPAARPW